MTKTVNAVLVAGAEELPSPAEPLPCIRCGACADVCPVRLLPQDLHARIAAGQLARALELHLSDCIECGCCDAVCPSRIPLTADFQRARQATRAMREERERADHARRRHEARQARLLREQRERESAARQRKAELGEGRSKIQAALDKARRKRAGGTPPPAAPDLTDGGSG